MDDERSPCFEAMAPLERSSCSWMHKDRLEAEYARMPLGRPHRSERKEKALLEARLSEIRAQMNQIKARLRALQPVRR